MFHLDSIKQHFFSFQRTFAQFAESRFEELLEFMENKIKTNSDFRDKIMLDNNEILCKINSNETREFHPGIVHAFENFCTLSEYCANSIIWEKALVAAVCPMLMTILSENFVPSRPTMLHGL